LTGPGAPDAPDEPPAESLQGTRAAAYRLLARRDRSKSELARRLSLKFPEAAVAAVIDELARDGYLDDARLALRLAESWAQERNFGPRRIRHELMRRGLAPLSDAEPDPDAVHAAALRAARRHLASRTAADPDDPRTVRRLAGYLERRGFSGATIRAIVRLTRQGELWSDP
jgi:regulatory protein